MAIGVGLIGSGAAAKRRARAIAGERRAQLQAVAGRDPIRREAFAATFGATAVESVAALVARADIELIVIATTNDIHGAAVRTALEAGKHVAVEYPLTLDPQEARALVALARERERLLHVEHIEVLGGVHAIARDYLPQLGPLFRASYRTIAPKQPAPRRWSYHHHQLGYPLSGALSRVHRVLDLLTPSQGDVLAVMGQSRFWEAEDGYFRACWCEAELEFAGGAMANVGFGKGETFWLPERTLELWGETGRLLLASDRGVLVNRDGATEIPIEQTRGSFATDTAAVLDHLETGQPLYVSVEASCRALEIADAARRSAVEGRRIWLATNSVD